MSLGGTRSSESALSKSEARTGMTPAPRALLQSFSTQTLSGSSLKASMICSARPGVYSLGKASCRGRTCP